MPRQSTATLDPGLEAMEDRRVRRAGADMLSKNIRDTAAQEAELYGVDVDIWLELPPDSRRKLMAKGKPQADRNDDAAPALRIDAGDTDNLERQFARMADNLIVRDDRKDWVLLCDPVKHDRRWGDYTPGVSKMPRAAAERKTNPAYYNPPFTVEPVAPFPPEPTVLCDLHGADGRVCDFATYEEEGSVEENTLLLYHQQRVHKDEFEARQLRNRNQESRSDREANRVLLQTIADLQNRLAAQEARSEQKESEA
jgi:hypothetical protein